MSGISRKTFTVSSGILCSRIFGYFRDMTIALYFGANFVTDAFFLAFMIPNLFRRLLAEGSLSAAFIPNFTELLKKSGKGVFLSLSGFMLTRENLAKLKQKAQRRGCWYKKLKQNERMLLDLTIRVVEKDRSFLLAKVVSRLVSTLLETLESKIVRLVRTEGREMARKLSEIAVKLGHKSAKSWAKDLGFMQYLVVNNLGELGK